MADKIKENPVLVNNFDATSPQLTEQLASNSPTPSISAVDYIYNSIKAKANTPSLLEKIDGVKNDADYFSSIFNATDKPKVSFNKDRIDINEAYSKLSDGTFITRYDKGFIKGADNEELYAEGQSTGSKWANGLTKFLGKTGVNVVGGVLGTAYGAVSAIAEGNWEQIYDNSFYDFLDDQNTKMDNFAANYRTQEERNRGFFSSMGTANFWADDFLGGLSFMTGIIISEGLWAAATGGVSLAQTGAKIGLRASKYFNIAKGVKEASKETLEYLGKEAVESAVKRSIKYGKRGELLNLARFTYTGAGFEAGMEARLYQREQKENFYRDFENLNGRKPSSQEISEFEDNLGKTTNMLWVANMALVGTSNFAILGKTFGITSPFKLPKEGLNKVLFGTGAITEFGEAGERLATKAIKRTKPQRVLGFSKELLRAPFYEGFVEEGGQATASTAMESYLTSRYNPSEDVMGIVESMYDGFSHTYGTKEGWKEVGLGMLIGFVGGEGSNVLSGQGFLTKAKNAVKEQDGFNEDSKKESGSVAKANTMNDIRGTEIVRSMFALNFEEKLAHATEVQNAEQEYKKAEDKGSVIEMANAQSKIMLNSVKYASNLDILEEQTKDFTIALKMQATAKEGEKSELAKHYGIEQSEVEDKISQLVSEYKALGEEYKIAKEFANYIVSNNPKENYEDGTNINSEVIKTAIASQMVMAKATENNLDGAHEALINTIKELGPQVSAKEIEALQNIRDLHRQSKEKIQDLAKTENKLKEKNRKLDVLIKSLNKADQEVSSTPEGNQRIANKRNFLAQKIEELQKDVITLQEERGQKRSEMSLNRDDANNLSAAGRALASQLDSVDPLASTDFVSEVTLEETQESLEKLDKTLEKLKSKNPQLVEKIAKLGQEYKKGLEIWKRNADTLVDLSNPEIGLNRIGTMMQRKKTAGTTTLEFLKRLQKTQLEDLKFSSDMNKLVNPKEEDKEKKPEDTDENEQTKAEKNPGDDILEDILPTDTEDTLQNKINELRNNLGKLLKDNYLLENFTNDPIKLQEEKAPTQDELDEYTQLRNDFKSGDINKLVGKPVGEISARIKERSGLSDAQITRYQELSQKMLDWRIVTGTNAKGVSIQDLLNQIAAYEKEVKQDVGQVTAEQAFEMAEDANYEIGQTQSDIGQTMTYVNVGKGTTHKEISHLSLAELSKNGFLITKVREENIGTEKEPNIVDVYEIEKDGEVYEVQRGQDTRHRIRMRDTVFEKFLKAMNLKTVHYKLKTAWGYIFKDGKLYESDYNMNKAEGEKLHPEEIYKLKPGSKVKFSISPNDSYNVSDILPLLEEASTLKKNTKKYKDLMDQAKANMAIYIRTSEGKTVALLKAGRNLKDNNANFNKVREAALKMLQDKLESETFELEVIANNENVFDIGFETEIEKIFIGTPNIELNEDGSLKVYDITEEQRGDIIDFGYAEKGKLNGTLTRKDDDVRMSFIPQNKNTPYVVIKQGDSKIAYPVGLKVKSSDILKEEITTILDSDIREQDKLVQIASLLKDSGIEPAQFSLDALKDNAKELSNLFSYLNASPLTYTKEDIDAMRKDEKNGKNEFLDKTEISIDLTKPAFVSPKVKMALSTKLFNLETKETTASKKLTQQEKEDLIIKHLVNTAKATTEEEVANLVMETGDEVFIQEFLENKKFKDQVVKSSLAKKPVPSIKTDTSLENLLEELIDLNYDDIPLDIREEFKQEVIDLKANSTKVKVKALAKKIKTKLENRYKLVNSSVDTENMYHIPTTETQEEMFERGYVKVTGNFYKKVDKKYDVADLLEGLYNKYKNGTLPTHITLDENLSLEEFVDAMPNTLLDIYKTYYNTQESGPLAKKATIIGNERYLREEFKGDFARFIQEEKNKGSELYEEVLQHFDPEGPSITKSDLLTRAKTDQFEKELGPMYSALLEYSLINKHIDLQEQPQNIIFAEDVENASRLEAVNSSKLPKQKGKIEIAMDGTVVFSKPNPTFVQMGNSVYEKTYTNNVGESVYEKIADIDPNFIITEVVAPFTTATIQTSKEIDGTKSNINTTDGREIDC